MKVSFVRTGEAKDRAHVLRADGSDLAFRMHTYGGALPHDVVHFVVECELGLSMGFWGRVARGADPERVNALANRRGGAKAGKFEAFGEALDQLDVAEVLANAPWLRADVDDLSCASGLREALEPLDGTFAAALDLERVRQLRSVVREWNERWQELGIREAIHAQWR